MRHICFFIDVVDCGDLPSISDGNLQYRTTSFDSRATLQCNEGYEINGNARYTCTESGGWQGTGVCG